MSKHKHYDAELKTKVVFELLKGQKTLAQLCREYEVSPDLACHWRDVFLERAPGVYRSTQQWQGQRGSTPHRRTGTDGRPLNDGVRCSKKSLTAAALSLQQRRDLVAGLAADYPVRVLCQVLDVAPSSYYYQPHAAEDLALREALEAVALEYPRYGSRRITAELRRRGWEINRKRVQRLMREANLLVEVKRYCQTTMSRHPYGRYPNLLKHLEIVRPNQVWCADLTYIRLPR